MVAYVESLKTRGVLMAVQSLRSLSDGIRVRTNGGTRPVVDGPFAEAKELVGGFFLLILRSAPTPAPVYSTTVTGRVSKDRSRLGGSADAGCFEPVVETPSAFPSFETRPVTACAAGRRWFGGAP
jgi:hypothetical protein